MAISTQGHELIIKDFIEAIQQDRQPLVGPESARLSIDLILAIYESARTGSLVHL
jgi:UDP-N-acetyl-2-amino-2-deoxyglucuronate dehydrogenase